MTTDLDIATAEARARIKGFFTTREVMAPLLASGLHEGDAASVVRQLITDARADRQIVNAGGGSYHVVGTSRAERAMVAPEA